MDYEEFFNNQFGCTNRIGRSYQNGHGGVGRLLAGLFRRVLPLLKKGAQTFGKEALRTGVNIMSDVATQNTPIREAFRKRVRESGNKLKRKAEEKFDKLMMDGSGYKLPYHHIGNIQLPGDSVEVNKCKRRKKNPKKKVSKKKKSTRKKPRTTRDIFD